MEAHHCHIKKYVSEVQYFTPEVHDFAPSSVFFFLPKKCIILGRGIPWLHPGFEKVYIFLHDN